MKKTISTLMVALVLFTSALVSCSKTGDKPSTGGTGDTSVHYPPPPPPPVSSYYMKMKIDGVQENFTIAQAAKQEDNGTFTLVVGGVKDSTSTEELDLVVSSSSTVGTGEYTEGQHDNYGIIALYAPANATDQQVFYGGVTPTPNAPVKITITQITDTQVKGTFSGTYYDQQGAGPNKKAITDGEFTAQIVQ
jgi:hypothetical protein